MIPSDHFVKFYNEVFKFLVAKGPEELRRYYDEISHHQELHCLKLFQEKGLQGMYDYWEHIRIEENCGMTLTNNGDELILSMTDCPSLGKVLDNDAGPCHQYCDHCPGWVLPLLTKANVFAVYNLIARDIPKCDMFVYTDRACAKKKFEELSKFQSPDVLCKNFD